MDDVTGHEQPSTCPPWCVRDHTPGQRKVHESGETQLGLRRWAAELTEDEAASIAAKMGLPWKPLAEEPKP